MRSAFLLLLLAASASAAPKLECEDDNVPIDGGTLIVHDCIVGTRAKKHELYDEHVHAVTLRFLPLEGKAFDAPLEPVSDGYEWRERWRVAAVLKDELTSGQAVLLALERGAEVGDLCTFEVHAIGPGFPALWEGESSWAGVKLDALRGRVRIHGKRATPTSDLDELERHGKTEVLGLALRRGKIVDISRERGP